MHSTFHHLARAATRLSQLNTSSTVMRKLSRFKSFDIKDIMSNNEINVYKKLFENMDSNKDGLLTEEDLKKGLKDFVNHSASDQEIREAMQILDADKKGSIDFDEFIGYVAWTRQVRLEETIRRAFEAVDRDKDGLIDKDGVREAMQALGISSLSDSSLSKVMAEADKDKDGKITLNEFRTVFRIETSTNN